MATRGVMLGITVNLGDYENLRLEATSDTFAEAALLIDDALREIQRNTNGATGNKIESYRKRVIAALIHRQEAPLQTYGEEPRAESLAGQPVIPTKAKMVKKPIPPTSTEPTVPTIPAEPNEHSVNTEAPPKEPALVDDAAIVCDECGDEISLSQVKVSQMFLGKNLCKKHMDVA